MLAGTSRPQRSNSSPRVLSTVWRRCVDTLLDRDRGTPSADVSEYASEGPDPVTRPWTTPTISTTAAQVRATAHKAVGTCAAATVRPMTATPGRTSLVATSKALVRTQNVAKARLVCPQVRTMRQFNPVATAPPNGITLATALPLRLSNRLRRTPRPGRAADRTMAYTPRPPSQIAVRPSSWRACSVRSTVSTSVQAAPATPWVAVHSPPQMSAPTRVDFHAQPVHRSCPAGPWSRAVLDEAAVLVSVRVIATSPTGESRPPGVVLVTDGVVPGDAVGCPTQDAASHSLMTPRLDGSRVAHSPCREPDWSGGPAGALGRRYAAM